MKQAKKELQEEAQGGVHMTRKDLCAKTLKKAEALGDALARELRNGNFFEAFELAGDCGVSLAKKR